MDCKTAGLLGKNRVEIADIVDIAIVVPSQDTPRIQETHVTIIHILCELVEKTFLLNSKIYPYILSLIKSI
jgi:D-sedoheptulose 7-phosphate isomerase